LGAFLEIILAISGIGTAIVLFPILRRQSESVSLGYVATRVVESTVIVVGLISLLSVVTLRQDFADTARGNPVLYVGLGKSLVAIHDWTFLLVPAFCAGFGNGILLGYLMYTSGLVPRPMGPCRGLPPLVARISSGPAGAARAAAPPDGSRPAPRVR
jgi:hypothetical protein